MSEPSRPMRQTLLRLPIKTYGKPHGKARAALVFRSEETRHNGLNGANTEETEDNHAISESIPGLPEKQKNVSRAGMLPEYDDLVDATVGMRATTTSPVAAEVADTSTLEETLERDRTRRTREGEVQTRSFRASLQRTEPNEKHNEATFVDIEAESAAASSTTTKPQTGRKHVLKRPRNKAANRETAYLAGEPSNSDSEGLDGARFKINTKRFKTTKDCASSHTDPAASLHNNCSVSEIKDFLSRLSDIYGNDRLLLHPNLISFSSKYQKSRFKHLKSFRECDTFMRWMRTPLRNASGRIGFFRTWTQSPVGQTKADFRREQRHTWAAVHMPGKLIIFDSNADLLPEEVSGNDLWLHGQRALVTCLKNEGYSFNVWVGGKGNNDHGICTQVTGKWIQGVMVGAINLSSDTVLLEEGFKMVENMWRVKV